MSIAGLAELQRDPLAVAVARALLVANDAAQARGTNPADSMVSIDEESAAHGRVWRVTYGPRNYVARRGGDLIIYVDESAGSVERVVRGQ